MVESLSSYLNNDLLGIRRLSLRGIGFPRREHSLDGAMVTEERMCEHPLLSGPAHTRTVGMAYRANGVGVIAVKSALDQV